MNLLCKYKIKLFKIVGNANNYAAFIANYETYFLLIFWDTKTQVMKKDKMKCMTKDQ